MSVLDNYMQSNKKNSCILLDSFGSTQAKNEQSTLTDIVIANRRKYSLIWCKNFDLTPHYWQCWRSTNANFESFVLRFELDFREGHERYTKMRNPVIRDNDPDRVSRDIFPINKILRPRKNTQHQTNQTHSYTHAELNLQNG